MILSSNGKAMSRLSLGTAALGSFKDKIFFGKIISDHNAVKTMLHALQYGINVIDTSPFYGDSERKVGLALSEHGDRESVVLSTKVGTHPEFKDYTADVFYRSIENSLKLLRTDYLDIVHIHDPTEHDFEACFSDNGGARALCDLKAAGVIRNIGLGVRTHRLHYRFIDSGIADVILPYLDYNLINQTAASLLEYARTCTINVLLGSPLSMGLLSGKDPSQVTISHYDIQHDVSIERAKKMFDWCCEKELNLLALNLAFILNNPSISSVIIGASTIEEIDASLHALKTPKLSSQSINI